MTTLREAAQQALEALEEACEIIGAAWAWRDEKGKPTITALRAALAQQAEPVPAHRINSWGFCGVCRHDRIPGEGCARQECPDSPQQAEPVEPYCYVYEYDGVFGLHREFYPFPYNGMKPSRTVPVYTAPPQRKPLTEEEIGRLCDEVRWSPRQLARAVERAHGIPKP